MQGLTEVVWNKGIAALCDRRIPDEFPDNRTYTQVPKLAGALWSRRHPEDLISDPSAFADVKEGELIWVRLSWLRSFVRQVLPVVQVRFVLVTGDSASSVPSELGPEALTILDCPKISHWFTQNYDGSGPTDRISPIPLGIDFHTLSQGPIWGEATSSPAEQGALLLSLRKGLRPLASRIPEVYVDFGWQAGLGLFHYRRLHPLRGARFREPRPAAARKLRRNPLVHFQTSRLSRSEMWRTRGEYAFVVSPHGMGLDCHRTWEALSLGHIVLVPSSSLDPLYEDLPVGVLGSWRDINPDNLRKWLSRHGEGRELHEKLTSTYWIRNMRLKAGTMPVGRST
jgi:hypothetical protein